MIASEKYSCKNCSYESLKWLGKCPKCSSWDTIFKEEKKFEKSYRKKTTFFKAEEIESKSISRIKSGILEWDNVLGGGIVPGSFLILTGDPGVGKSTLLLQVSSLISQSKKVVYFSSEESLEQLKLRVKRLKLESSKVLFSDQREIEGICSAIENEKPELVLIDSLQNCSFFSAKNYSQGGPSQLREAAQVIIETAKKNNVSVILTGHITKEGIIAGPKILEHLVDAVFYLQNEDRWQNKILRSVKNRFGPVEEVGFFEMQEAGLSEVKNVNERLILESNSQSFGSVLSYSFQGSRFVFLEIQALCVPTKFSIPQRVVGGIDPKRVLIIAAILEKYLKLKMSSVDIFFKISGLTKASDSHLDLAIAIALVSSYLKESVQPGTIAFGEINLTGQIKPSRKEDVVIKNGIKLGAKKIICSSKSTQAEVSSIKSIYEVLNLKYS